MPGEVPALHITRVQSLGHDKPVFFYFESLKIQENSIKDPIPPVNDLFVCLFVLNCVHTESNPETY